MYILIGLIMMVFFLFGFSLGILFPYLIKKYFNVFDSYIKENDELVEKLKMCENEIRLLKSGNPENVIDDLKDTKIFDEWLNGGGNDEN